jgi:hypothetical protein
MYPCYFARYTQKHFVFLLNRARFEQSADFAFAASKRTAKTVGFSTERNTVPVGRGLAPPAHPLFIIHQRLHYSQQILQTN